MGFKRGFQFIYVNVFQKNYYSGKYQKNKHVANAGDFIRHIKIYLHFKIFIAQKFHAIKCLYTSKFSKTINL